MEVQTKNGNTAQIAKTMLGKMNYETLNLVDYKVFSYGQHFQEDQFDFVVNKITEARLIVIGSHSLLA